MEGFVIAMWVIALSVIFATVEVTLLALHGVNRGRLARAVKRALRAPLIALMDGAIYLSRRGLRGVVQDARLRVFVGVFDRLYARDPHLTTELLRRRLVEDSKDTRVFKVRTASDGAEYVQCGNSGAWRRVGR